MGVKKRNLEAKHDECCVSSATDKLQSPWGNNRGDRGTQCRIRVIVSPRNCRNLSTLQFCDFIRRIPRRHCAGFQSCGPRDKVPLLEQLPCTYIIHSVYKDNILTTQFHSRLAVTTTKWRFLNRTHVGPRIISRRKPSPHFERRQSTNKVRHVSNRLAEEEMAPDNISPR